MRIPWRYPAVEAGTALLCGVIALAKWGDGVDVWLGLVLVLLLVPITLIDLERHIIPNQIVAVGSIAAVALLGFADPGALPEHAIAAVAAGGFLLVAAIVYPAGMGMGDVKLAFMLGLFLGRAVAPAMFTAMIVGSLVGALIIARVGVAKGRKMGIPFGPYLALGGLVAVLVGDMIVDWYLRTFV
jgi:leader peptidase (prepilin peptidase)/N-methyltransferase